MVQQILRRVAPAAEPVPRVSSRVMRLLQEHDWPGNIRELENALRHAVVMSRGCVIEAEHLPGGVGSARARLMCDTQLEKPRRRKYVAPRQAGREVELIREALRTEGGSYTLAAARLGMSRSTLWAKIKQYRAELEGVGDDGC
jgi:DNA-binding NtrC family response regulator